MHAPDLTPLNSRVCYIGRLINAIPCITDVVNSESFSGVVDNSRVMGAPSQLRQAAATENSSIALQTSQLVFSLQP